jgi:hypothetical protein
MDLLVEMNEPRTTDHVIAFPPPPVEGTARLIPITSWYEMYRETILNGVEFDLFWLESVEERVAYFFRWIGEPRCTVLVVWSSERLHIECQKANPAKNWGTERPAVDPREGQAVALSAAESLPIEGEVTYLFRDAGFCDTGTLH